MSYYINSSGAVLKLLQTPSKIIVMCGFRTLFFDTNTDAGDFIRARGFYKRG